MPPRAESLSPPRFWTRVKPRGQGRPGMAPLPLSRVQSPEDTCVVLKDCPSLLSRCSPRSHTSLSFKKIRTFLTHTDSMCLCACSTCLTNTSQQNPSNTRWWGCYPQIYKKNYSTMPRMTAPAQVPQWGRDGRQPGWVLGSPPPGPVPCRRCTWNGPWGAACAQQLSALQPLSSPGQACDSGLVSLCFGFLLTVSDLISVESFPTHRD